MHQAPTSPGYAGLRPYGQSGTGRTLLVNSHYKQMLDQFQQLSKASSSEGYHAQAITRAVGGLRGCVAPANSFMKNGNPNRRCIVFSGFEIEYELNSYYGGPQTDVVIVDIRLTPQSSSKIKKAALWRTNYQETRSQWITAEEPSLHLSGDKDLPGNENQPIKVGINGYCNNLNHAAGMLPSHIAKGEKIKLNMLKGTGYQLFYVPQSGSAIKAGWSFIKELGQPASQDEQQAARILAHHIKEAHDKGLHVEWTSHRGGSKVLTQAMKLLAKANINLAKKQKIFLSDHTSDQYEADLARRALGMNTDDSKWHNSTPGVAQLLGGRSLGAADLSCSINELFHHTPREERAGKVIDTFVEGKKAIKSAMAAGSSIAVIVNTFGFSAAFASAICSTLASTTLASIPSLNEGYHKSSTDPAKQLANKLVSKK
ncbi:hypothetical protein [Microbulbifer sp. SAOS-129_SWC]|uniref:hypothetical protein n=1 Tax=Microbulbifer sp. SAOS-129_SWC TaxID=3145235 RepID=UPI0032176D09